jgi:hypothetical protein
MITSVAFLQSISRRSCDLLREFPFLIVCLLPVSIRAGKYAASAQMGLPLLADYMDVYQGWRLESFPFFGPAN